MILGFSCYMRDAAAALVQDGRIVAAVEEERLTREKHTGKFPEAAIRWCLAEAGITARDLDGVAFNMRPVDAIPGRLAQILKGLPGTLAFRARGGDFLEMVTAPARFAYSFGTRPWHWVRHHDAHAASAFLFSPFEQAAVLVADGSGEIASTTTYAGQGTGLRQLGATNFPHSLGYFYSALTEWLGFPPASDEGTVMGLSSYGRPSPQATAHFRAMIDDRGHICPEWFAFQDGGSRYYGPRWLDAFGPARSPEEPVTERHQEVAAAGQARLEAIVLAMLCRLHAETRLSAVCLAGGVALNCVANGRILEDTPFQSLFVQPAASDSGTALGAAALVEVGRTGRRPAPLTTMALGPRFSRARTLEAIKRAGLTPGFPKDVAADAAARLASGQVIGWFDGGAEFGPRALGHRSILADPRTQAMADRVNRVIKRREPFRPFAPAVLEEHMASWFTGTITPFMTTVARVRPERRGQIDAVTHVDGTARAQAVSRADAPAFHAVIAAFRDLTGVPMVLNTSFNLKGEPIVCTPEEALADLLSANLDAVYLDGICVEDPAAEAPRQNI